MAAGLGCRARRLLHSSSGREGIGGSIVLRVPHEAHAWLIQLLLEHLE